MSAETHLEVYRRFQGKLHEHPLRFLPLWTSGLRTALKQRRALIFLYLPVLIGTVIVSFVVYLKFTAQTVSDELPGAEAGLAGIDSLGQRMALAKLQKMLDVVQLILEFSKVLGAFSILAVAWFASGLFCEDKKAGAHQLYFARPITRLDYALGKFLTAATFAALTTLVPGLVICTMAALCSPEWSFLKEQGDVFLRVIAFGLVWTTAVSSLVLACSSLASRRSFALLGVIACVFMAPAAAVLGQFVDERFFALILLEDLNVLAKHVFGDDTGGSSVSPGNAWAAVLLLVVASWSLIWLRLRRLEVVA